MGEPGFYWFEGDYLRDTAHLSNDEDLAYRRLLGAYYSKNSPLPASIERLQNIARVPIEAVRSVAEEFLPIGPDGLRHNKKADKEIARRNAWLADQGRKAKLGSAARWGKDNAHGDARGDAPGVPVGMPERCPKGCPNDALPSPSPSPSPTTTKKPMSEVKPSDAAMGLSEFMLASIRQRLPKFKQPNLASWARDCDRMIRLDKRDPEQARRLLEWMAGDFWGTVVLCPAKLREKWDQIEAKRSSSIKTATGKPDPTKPVRYFSVCKCGTAGNHKKHGICDACDAMETVEDMR